MSKSSFQKIRVQTLFTLCSALGSLCFGNFAEANSSLPQILNSISSQQEAPIGVYRPGNYSPIGVSRSHNGQELDPVKAQAQRIQQMKDLKFIPQNATREQIDALEGTPEENYEDMLLEGINVPDTENVYQEFRTGLYDQIEIRVHRDRVPQVAEIFHNQRFVKSYWISTGLPGHGTPDVDREVYERTWNRNSGRYGGTMTGAMMYYGGYGVHMTPFLSELGRPASHGCIRIEDAGIYKIWELALGIPNANIFVNVLSGQHSALAPRGRAPYEGGQLQKIETRIGRPANGRPGASEV